MADQATVADVASQNGHGDSVNGGDPEAGKAPSRGGLLGRIASSVSSGVQRRLTANLDDRDPDYIREKLPLSWLVASLYFRSEVRNLGNIPEDRPVLLVGNHSGGNMTPDTMVFNLAFSTYFGVERRYHQLAHSMVLASPYGQFVRKFGTVSASHEHAHKALSEGAALLVYPGGDWEVHRPSWESSKIDFAGRKGFIRLAIDAGVPIVPVVSIGGQETALFLGQFGNLAKTLRLDRALRLKVLPISIAPPWGLNIGDFLGHLPLPAKITIEVLPPIDLKQEFGPEPDHQDVYDHITRQMQDALDALASERRLPVIG